MDELWQIISTTWDSTLWDASFGSIVISIGVIVIFMMLRKIFTNIVIKRIRYFTDKTENKFDDKLLVAVKEPLKFVFVILGFYIATNIVYLEPTIADIGKRIVTSLITFTLFWTLYRCIDPLSYVLEKISTVFGSATQDLKGLTIKVAKTLIFIFGAAAILDEWGINVTGFLASLGIVGMAVALAAKDFVANLFGSLTIFLDKTFKKGDWIMTPHVEGTVEEIGLRATKIRTFADAEETIPNATLANHAMTNWSRMNKRRIKMRIGLEYSTSRAQVQKILKDLQDFISNHEEIHQNSTQLIHLVEFNDSSIDILLYYFTKTTNWAKWMEVREENMLEFMRIVEENGSAFAFPSRSLYIESMPENVENA